MGNGNVSEIEALNYVLFKGGGSHVTGSARGGPPTGSWRLARKARSRLVFKFVT